MRYVVELQGQSIELDVTRDRDEFRVRGTDGRELRVRSLEAHPELHTLLVEGRIVSVQAREREATLAGGRFQVRAQSERERAAQRTQLNDARGSKQILAPMPGRIVRVACAPGARVSKGDALVVIEAMKMQNELRAKLDGVVREVRVTTGANVERGAVLVELE
ncbi:MAG TPA: biotin/lipoyl-containing protein [Polyangiaceae bacterium]|nr:biotin/lipoyl-containing protein [Polyangiaceae bacterium]